MTRTGSEDSLKLEVKHAEAAHIGDLIRIGNASGLSPWSAKNYLDEMKRDDSVILRIVSDHEPVLGFVCGRIPTIWPHEAEIFNIGVMPDTRGLGQTLLSEFLKICRDRKVRTVWLEVRASNERAKSFYVKNNFVAYGIRKNFYSTPTEDAVIMGLSLENRTA